MTAHMQLDIVVDETISETGSEELVSLFADVGIEARIEATYPPGAVEHVSASQARWATVTRTDAVGYFHVEPAWTVLIYAPVNRLVQEIGADTTRDLIESIWAARTQITGAPGTAGLVLLVDEDTGIRIHLESQLPLRAYEVLTGLKLPAFRTDPISYKRSRGHEGHWQSPK